MIRVNAGARRDTYSRAYLIFVFPIVLALTVLIGPFGASDEVEHFLRANTIARGEVVPLAVFPSSQRARGLAGGLVDREVAAIAREDDYKQRYRAVTSPDFKFSYNIIKNVLRRVANGNLEFSEHNNTALYPPIFYMGSAFGIYVGEKLGVPVLAWLYLGRLFNAAITGLTAFFAIKAMPGKPAFALLAASLPIVLFQSATVSADALLFAAFLGFSALMYRLATMPKQSHAEVALTGLIVCAISAGKVAYVPLAALPFSFVLIRDRRFSRQAAIYAVFMLLAVALWAAWAYEIHDKVFSMRPAVVIDPAAQIAGLKAHPLTLVYAIGETLHLQAKQILLDSVGHSLGHSTIWIKTSVCVLLMSSLVASASISLETSAPRIKPAYPLLTIILSGVCAVAVMVSLYVQFNRLGSSYVEGVQGRYFLPLILLCLAVLPCWALKNASMPSWITKGWRLYYVGLSSMGGAITAMAVLFRYWIGT